MELILTNLDRPCFRLGLSLVPEFGANKTTGATGISIHASLEMVPRVGLNVERHRFLDPFVVAGNFEDAAVAGERDEVALIDQSHGGHGAAGAVRHHVRFERVIFHVRFADEVHRALEQDCIEAVGDDLVAVLFQHLFRRYKIPLWYGRKQFRVCSGVWKKSKS